VIRPTLPHYFYGRNKNGCMAKDTFYFSHDFNARQDEKIKRLIRKHKMQGYGIFWAIVEDLYNNANALETDYEGIAFDYHSDINTIKSIIHDFDLFVFEGTTFGSISIERRLNERNEKSAKASKSAHYRWQKHKENANAMQTHSDSNAIKEKKGKESNNNKENKIDFELFWNLYDKKEQKDSCLNKWNKLDFETQTKIIEILPSFIAWKSDKKYRPNPQTFLNQKRWLDEIPTQTITPKYISQIPAEENEWH